MLKMIAFLVLSSVLRAECPVVDYTYVCDDDAEIGEDEYRNLSHVIKAVKVLVKKGWEPTGGLVSDNGRQGTTSFCQAMVKRKCKPQATPTPAKEVEKIKADVKPLTVNVENPYYICLIDGVAHNCNQGDPYTSDGINPDIAELYIAIKNQTTVVGEVVILANRLDPLPSLVAFSTSGEGCPNGIISYCKDIKWMILVNGKWTLVEEK